MRASNTEQPAVRSSEQRDDLLSMPMQLPVRQRRGRWAWLSLLLLVLLAAGAASYFFYFAKDKQGPSWQSQAATQGNLTVTVNATGSIVAPIYNVDFDGATGTVAEIDVSVGQKVHKGQVLARLNRTQLEDALKQAKDTLRLDQDRGVGLDEIQIAQDQVDTAQHNLDTATLTAPHGGVITVINGTVGSSSSGSQSSTTSGTSSFFQIQDESTLQAVVNVSEADMAALNTGDTASFTLAAFRSNTFQGKISKIVRLATTVNDTTTYPITIDVPSVQFQGLNVIPGMNVEAMITVLTHQNVLLIPVQALSFAQQADTSNLVRATDIQSATQAANQLLNSLKQSHSAALTQEQPYATFVIESKNGNLTPIPVVLGTTDGVSYEVLAGLSLPASVVVGGASQNNSSGAGK